MKDFEGKIAVVTGGASGIGNAVAKRFAQEGMRVVLADVEEPALDDAVVKLRQQDRRGKGGLDLWRSAAVPERGRPSSHPVRVFRDRVLEVNA